MKKLFNEVFFWLLPVFLVATFIPVGFYYILHSDLPLWVLMILIWFKLAANYLFNILQTQAQDNNQNCEKIYNDNKQDHLKEWPDKLSGSKKNLTVRSLQLLSGIITGAGVFLIIAIINITPYSIFRYWIESPSHIKDAVIISNIFVMLAALFSALQCGTIFIQRTYKPLLVLQAMLLGLAVTIKPHPFFIILLAISFVGIIFVYIKKNRILYLAILMSAALAGVGIFSLFPSPQGSFLVDNFISPQLRYAVNRLIPDYPLIMGLPGYGNTFSEDKLGGTPTLSSINLFEIEGSPDKLFYLREEVYDFYTGSEWKLALIPAQPLGTQIITIPPPASQILLKLKLIKGPYFLLPHTLATEKIQFNDQVVRVPFQAVWDSKTILKKPLPSGTIIYLVATAKAASPTGREPVNESGNPDKSEAQPIRPSETTLASLAPYLQIPASLPSNIKDRARYLSTGLYDTRDKLKSIEDFLFQNNTYDLHAPTLGKNEDFVEKFLFDDKRGYCVHFASAFIILARLNNIPARYVTGYLLPAIVEPTHTGKRLLSGLTAHAWAEIWLPEKGWITWEATPAVNPDYRGDSRSDNFPGGHLALNADTLRQLSGMIGRTLNLKQTNNIPVAIPSILPALVSLMVYAGLIFCGFGLAGLFIFRFFELINAKFYPRQASLKLVKKLSHASKDLPAPQKYGWIEWIAALKSRNPDTDLPWTDWERIILKARYSNQDISGIELQTLKKIRKVIFKFPFRITSGKKTRFIL